MVYKELLFELCAILDLDFDNICFSVSTKDFDFPFSFFAFETDDFFGIYVTNEDGTEKIHAIVKSEIVYLRVHYLDEIGGLMEPNSDNKELHKIYI